MSSKDLKNISSGTKNWFDESVVQYAFNLPSVGANLERLIGTNVVRMTDYKFMMLLRDRIWSDFDTDISRRIQARKEAEIEREKQLILKGKYNSYNCPKKLVPLHSAVLALDLSDESLTKIVKEQSQPYEGPVFNINKRTNLIVSGRRSKLKSNRQKNYDYLMRQCAKMEESSKNKEYDESTIIKNVIKTIEEKSKLKKFLQYMERKIKKSGMQNAACGQFINKLVQKFTKAIKKT